MMDKGSRKLARWCIWIVLACCFLFDGALGEGAISGVGDVAFLDSSGQWRLPGPEPKLWVPIGGFILFQGVLIFALIRLREPKSRHNPLFSVANSGFGAQERISSPNPHGPTLGT